MKSETKESNSESEDLNSSNSCNEENNKFKDEYNKLLLSIIKRYNKKKYREIFTEIEKNKKKYGVMNLTHNLIFTHFQLRCLFKITEQKIKKYYKEKYIKGIFNCFNLIEKKMENFNEEIEYLTIEKKKEQYEYLFYFHLLKIYNFALLKKHDNNINDCLCYLSLAEKLINKLSFNISYSKIWILIIKIYLFISSLLISKQNFLSAQNYLFVILQLSFKTLDLNIFISQYYRKRNFEKEINEIFFYILISFYQLGCINENLNNFKNAENSFQQSNYISLNILNNKFPEISFFIKGVFERMKNYFLTYKLISNMNINIENFLKKKKKIFKTIYTNQEEKKMKNLQKIENFIEKINLNEIDDDHINLLTEPEKKPKSEKIEKMVKNLYLLNYLISDDFKPTILNLKSLNINLLDNNIKPIIQKKILSIKNNKSHKNFLSQRNQNKKIYDDLLIKNKKSNSTNFKTLNSSSNKIQKNNSLIINSYKHLSRNKPLKINYDKYTFNQNYISKNNFLQTQIDKEYNFHKNLLNTKKYEKINIEPFNLEKIKSETNLFYNIELDKNLKILKEKNKSIKTEENINKHNILIERLKYILKEKSCKSLNIKQHNKYKQFVKKFAKRESQIRSERLLKLFNFNDNNDFDDLFENHNLNNENIIQKIGNDMHKLDKKEISLKKIKFKIKSHFSQKN